MGHRFDKNKMERWRWVTIIGILSVCFAVINAELHEDQGEQRDIIELDAEEVEAGVPEIRHKRQAFQMEEGSGLEEDDDEDYYVDPSSNDEIIPTRPVIPSMNSPTFIESSIVEPTLSFAPSNTVYATKTRNYEIEEGSGDEEYEVYSTIITTPTGRESSGGDLLARDFEPTSVVTPVITPTMVVTEPIDNAPYLNRRLRKFAVTLGHSKIIPIPPDTFQDVEDGNSRNLQLSLLNEDGTELPGFYWVKFNPVRQEILTLPVKESDVGRWKFLIRATDSKGNNVTDSVEIAVRQHSSSRLFNHQFNIEFSFTDWNPVKVANWEWKMLDILPKFFKNNGFDNMIVRKIEENPSFVFGWTNASLIERTCPKEDIKKLYRRMANKNQDASHALKNLLGAHIYVKSVTLEFQNACKYTGHSGPAGKGTNNTVPAIRNPIDRINVTAGELLRYKVPDDTCFDEEDGGTTRLSLKLLTMGRHELPPDAWLQFDEKNQEFFGIPLEEEVGRVEYQLVCSDKNGLSAIDGIEVVVLTRPFSETNLIDFIFDFDGSEYDSVLNDARGKITVLENIAEHFGDPDIRNIVLRTVNPDRNRLVWYNKTFNNIPCDKDRIDWMRSRLVQKDGDVRRDLRSRFLQLLPLSNVSVILKGRCAEDLPPTTDTPPEDRGTNILHGIIPSADYLLTFIIPAVIITCMLLLAILLACLLHKKRKAGKLNLFYSEALPPRVPVILQDELYDDDQYLQRHNQPVRLQDDRHSEPQEFDQLLHHSSSVSAPPSHMRFDPRGMSRPTPAYQRKQV